ncbi:hypothetical protein [Paludisphaera rhizosphaerae]|uniref:hypothetical protein n=1 Tax=Paludisphaera rhizosphaerae TaxID=2711216 RepID=UPI0013EDBB4D|nr:hypothetical protein [Paludisphaera rhizosphaerae]
MKPTTCGCCGGTQLTEVVLTTQHFCLRFGPWFAFSKYITPKRAMVCPDCGAVTPFLDEKALQKVRSWRREEREAATYEKSKAGRYDDF